MCEKCKPIDDQITHYRILGAQITDPQTLDGIRHLVEELEATKQALHAEDKETPPAD